MTWPASWVPRNRDTADVLLRRYREVLAARGQAAADGVLLVLEALVLRRTAPGNVVAVETLFQTVREVARRS